MTPIAIVTCAAVLWSCAVTDSFAAADAVAPGVQVTDASEGPSLSDITKVIETKGFQTTGPLLELLGSWMFQDSSVEGRGKKQKPMKMAMVMTAAAGGGMMMMKAMGAIGLFIIHAFLATKLGLIIGLYLLLCKMMEMKQTPKKVIKWVSPPSHYDEHPAPVPMMGGGGPYPESQSSYMEQHMEPQQQQQQQHQPADQYGPPPQQQYMPSGDFGGTGGGGDMQAHYSHVSPVTYRPVINRGQSDGKSGQAAGRIQ